MPGDRRGLVRPLFGLGAEAAPAAAGRKEKPQTTGSEKAGKAERGRAADAAAERASGPADAAGRQVARLPQRGEGRPARRLEQRLSVVPNRLPAEALKPPEPDLLQGLPTAAARTPDYGTLIGFAVCVLLPVLIAAVYYTFVASERYVAEFRFTVKEASSPSSPSAPSGLQSLLGMVGGNNAFDNYLVTDFLSSRQAVEELEQRIHVTSLYARPEVDWFSRYDARQPIEEFVDYWQSMITAHYDQVTGIATAKVSAFSPEDALLIADTLVKLSEELVNKISQRSQIDAVRFAQQEVEAAEERLKAVRAKLTEYRSRAGFIDPTTSVVASNSTLIQTLKANLAQMETQLATLLRQNLQPDTPVIVALQNQIRSTREQLKAVEATVAGGGEDGALSRVIGEYEQLELEREFAQNMVTSTMAALQQARANATAQHLYITPYVRPSLPQSAAWPQPLRETAKVGALAFALWLMGLLVLRSIRERFA